MAQAQKLTKVFGNLCRDPEVIEGNPRTESRLVRTEAGIESRDVEVSGSTFRVMTIAVDFPAEGPNGTLDWDNKTTEFFSVLDFSNPLPELDASKGDRIVVEGEYRTKPYTSKDGEEREEYQLIVGNSGGTVRVVRRRGGSAAAADEATNEAADDEIPF